MVNNELAPQDEIWEQLILEAGQKSDGEIAAYVEAVIKDKLAAGEELPRIGHVHTRGPATEEEIKRAAYRCLYTLFRIEEQRGFVQG